MTCDTQVPANLYILYTEYNICLNDNVPSFSQIFDTYLFLINLFTLTAMEFWFILKCKYLDTGQLSQHAIGPQLQTTVNTPIVNSMHIYALDAITNYPVYCCCIIKTRITMVTQNTVDECIMTKFDKINEEPIMRISLLKMLL